MLLKKINDDRRTRSPKSREQNPSYSLDLFKQQLFDIFYYVFIWIDYLRKISTAYGIIFEFFEQQKLIKNKI